MQTETNVNNANNLNNLNNANKVNKVNNTDLADKLQTLEAHLNQLQDLLVRSQRLAGMGTMTSMVAHEFNNLLTPIVSYSQFALGQDDPQLWHKALTQAYESGQKAVDVAGRLLGFAKGAGDEEESDVREVIDDALKSLVRDLSKDNITLTIEAVSVTAAVQPQMLQQVLYNLILNARQAMLGRPGRLTIRAITSENRAEITVADTGPGIDPQILPRIFDPFFTTKKSNAYDDDEIEGTGLGLAISRYIIAEADGTLTVESTPGEGTCFTIVLPTP